MTKTLKQFIKDNNIKMTVSEISERPDMKWDNANHFKCRLKNKTKSVSIYYSQGYGIKNKPEIDSVLDSLKIDFISQDLSFKDFCSEFGYSTDSLSALKTYKLCFKNTNKVKKLFNGSLNDFLMCESL
jgi:hypothetical protein